MPAPSWLRFGNNNQNTDENQGEFDPVKFQAEISKASRDQIEAMQADFDSKLAPVNEMAAYIRGQKEENERRLSAQRTQQNREDSEVDEELAIINPLEAMRRMNEPALRQAQAAAAITMRREVLGDKEYYTGDFKSKVDAMIEQQPLSLRANSQVLDNCYKVVLADHVQDILAGKLKKQVSYTSFESRGNTKSEEERKKDEDTLSVEEKYVAGKFGLTDEQWNSTKKEMNYV